jgi:predicted cupin superfamily sugar epimerase
LKISTKEVIEHFKMTILPIEGTYFSKTYESSSIHTTGGPDGTAILGLYSDAPRSCSLFHKLTSDEVWHFYAGDPIRLILLYPNKETKIVILGSDFKNGELIQFVVPKGVWQAGEIVPGGDWGLFGCTMAPGFSANSFEGGYFKDLIKDYPSFKDYLERLSVPEETAKLLPSDYKD